MSTISTFAAGSYRTNRTTDSLLTLKSQLDTLTTQLASGRAAETYGGLGAGRTTSLSAHATLSALDGYDAAITGANTRVSLAAASLQQVTSLSSTMQKNLSNSLLNGTNASASGQLATNSLSAAIDALNQNSAGQYLFSGRATDTQPVLDSATILNGDAGKGLDGLAKLVVEQKAADLGTAGNGRLSVTAPAAGSATLSLSEETSASDPTGEIRANFGFTLPKTPTATSSVFAITQSSASTQPAVTLDHAPTDGQSFRVTVNQPDGSQKTLDLTTRANPPAGSTDSFPVTADGAAASAALAALVAPGTVAGVQSANPPALTATFSGGTPAAYQIGLTAQPSNGDSVTVTLGLHDGTTTTVTLTARTTPDAGATGQFAIGATKEETAANLATALGTSLKSAASGTLSASSTARAAADFFNGTTAAGQEPKRIVTDASGNPHYTQAPQGRTVIWYQGDASDTDARSTATVRIGANQDLSIGARADEPAIRTALAGIAALAVETVADPAGATGTARFKALADRAGSLLTTASGSPGLNDITGDFSLASSALSNAKTLNASTRATLQSSLDGVETVSTEEVATKLLAVQNRLQASYQITATLSKLSLVNYMS